MEKPKHGLFITGTDTGVGKTFVTALIARSLIESGKQVGVYKPIASGCERIGDRLVAEDAERLRAAAGGKLEIDDVCPQRFAAPLAPHLAARAEGKVVDAELLRTGISVWKDRCEIVLVEGAGGLMSPISDVDYVADLAFDLGYPLLVVAPNGLGVINQTLQTLITASTFRDGLDVAGIVLNDLQPQDPGTDPSVETNYEQLASHCVPPVSAHVRWQAVEIKPSVDWMRLAARDNRLGDGPREN